MTALWLLINVYPPKESPGSIAGIGPCWVGGGCPASVGRTGEPQSNFMCFVKKEYVVMATPESINLEQANSRALAFSSV